MKNLNLQVTFSAKRFLHQITKKSCGNAVRTRSHPTTPLILQDILEHFRAKLFWNIKPFKEENPSYVRLF